MSNYDVFPIWYKFKAFGVLRPGYIKVELIPPKPKPNHLLLIHVPITEISSQIVPFNLRKPNSIFWALVEHNFVVTEVRSKISEKQSEHYNVS